MKIGILTFHSAHNYGAVLQCFALQETLKAMGHNVEVIDYRPPYITKVYGRFYHKRYVSKNPIKMARKILFEIAVFTRRIRIFNGFSNFINNVLNLSYAKTVTDDYDAYIIGSDQVWRPELTEGIVPYYFANFPFEKGQKKYLTYAVSMGGIDDGPGDDYLHKALKNFDAISVREEYLADYLRTLTNKTIHTVLDPSLLAERKIWDRIAKVPAIKSKYVVVYQVRKYRKEALNIARDIAKEIGAVVISLNLHFRSPNGYTCTCPEEFVGAIKGASCVVTTSFHGTAFALIFERPFYNVGLGDAGDMRAKALLETVGLQDRFIMKTDHPKFSEIDFSTANAKLEELQQKSKEFLINSLK